MALASLTEIMSDTVPALWYSSDFRSVIEDHLVRLRTRNSVSYPISTDEGRQHVGDFYSLLTSRNLVSKYHWIILRVNKHTCPYKYSGESFDLIIPDQDFIETIYDNYRSSYGS